MTKTRKQLVGISILSAVLLCLPFPGQGYSLKMTRNEPRQPQFWCRDIRVAIAANHHPDYSTGELTNAVRNTIERFAQLTPVRLSLVDTQASTVDPTCSVDDGQCPNAWIGFPPTWDGYDPARSAFNIRWFDTTTGEISASNILLHPEKIFGVVDPANPTPVIDLESTIMHEFGHMFGLGHSEFPDATMWGGDAIESETRKRSMHPDDKNGLNAVYTRERMEACGYAVPEDYVFTVSPNIHEKAIEFYNLAVDPYNDENWAVAERLAKKAVELDPDQLAAIGMLVWVNQHQGDWEEVLLFGEKYLQLDSDNKEIMQSTLYAAEITKTAKNPVEIEQMQRASYADQDADLYQQAIDAINTGDDIKGASLLAQIIEASPDFAPPYFEFGKIKVRAYEFDEAVRYFRQYLRLDPAGKNAGEAEVLVKTLSQ